MTRGIKIRLLLFVILSAVGIAWTDRIMATTSGKREQIAH